MRKACSMVLAAVLAACGGGSTTGECDTASDCPTDYPYACVGGQCVPATNTGGDGVAGGDPVSGGDGAGGGDALPAGDSVVVTGDGIIVPDVTGPEITIISPTAYEMVGGFLIVELKVVDRDSDVDEASVAVTIIGAGNPADAHQVPMLSLGGGDFLGFFDTRELGYLLYPVIVAVARDLATPANESQQGHVFILDNVPPTVALSSATVQVERGEDETKECSLPFNPLGDSAVVHGEVVSPAGRFGMVIYPRARIEDCGNGADVTNTPLPVAGVDDATTFLFILDQVGLQAGNRLVQGSGAGTPCTGLDPRAVPDPAGRLPTQAVVQRLVPVPPGGQGDFSARSPTGCRDTPTPAPDPYPDPPDSVCDIGPADGLTYWWYAGPSSGRKPAIYVTNAYDAGSLLLCTGGPFDTRTLAEGPACVAAVAVDEVGNLGVSAPIAICVNHGGADECAGFNPSSVSCSDNCVADGFSMEMVKKE